MERPALITVVALVTLTACATGWEPRYYRSAAMAAISACGATKKYSRVAFAQCVNEKQIEVAQRFRYPHMDLVELANERRLDLAYRQDAGRISPELAAKELMALYQVTIWKQEIKRGDYYLWGGLSPAI